MPVRCVAFDADDTLWDFTSVMGEAVDVAISVAVGHHPHLDGRLTRAALVAHWGDLYRSFLTDPEPGVRLADLRTTSFARGLDEHGIDDPGLVRDMSDRYYRHRHGAIVPFAGSAEVLTVLADRYVVGLITNGNTDTTRGGLASWFEFRLVADAVGVRKPDPRIFAMAAAAAGCHPSELVYVGDEPVVDVTGAQAAGCRAVWVNRSGAECPPGIHPDATITDLAELSAALDHLDAQEHALLGTVGVGPHPEPWPEDPRLDPEILAAGDRRNVVDRYRYWREEAIVADLARRQHGFHVAVENWRHDRNIGAVVRNANAFGAAGVHIVGKRRWNRRGAMATDRYLEVHHHDDLGALAAWAAGEGLAVVGIDNVAGAVDLESTPLPERCVLLFGQEGPGLSPEAVAAASTVRSIGQFGSTRSINAGVASGIAMHAWVRAHARPPEPGPGDTAGAGA